MKIEKTTVRVSELCKGYSDDGDGGVMGYGCSVDLGNNIFLKRACYKIQPQVRKTFADNRNIKVNWRVVYINGGIIKAEIKMVDIIKYT